MSLHGIYKSGMVLQRECNNSISGKADSDEEITLMFRGKEYRTSSDKTGSWEIFFDPGKAGGPDTLVVSSASSSIRLDDVYTGEVWLCSGQSNMQLQMNRIRYSFPEEFMAEENPCVRVFTVPVRGSFTPLEDIDEGQWLSEKPSNIADMSGVSYFFGKKLNALTGVPIGIINASQGGSPITAWMSEDCFNKASVYSEQLKECKDSLYVEKKKEEIAEKIKTWYENLESCDKGLKEKWSELDSGDSVFDSWQPFMVPGKLEQKAEAGVFWFNKKIELSKEEVSILNEKKACLWLGRITDSDAAYVNGKNVGGTAYMYPPRRYAIPAGLLHEGKNTLTLRVTLTGNSGPLLFEEEKPYMLFSANVLSCAWRKALYSSVCNSEEERKAAVEKGFVCIDLSGEWRYSTGSTSAPCEREIFFDWKPTALYNAMLYPLRKVAFRGAVWYQGESNAGNPEEYKDLLKKMVELWRSLFKNSPVMKDGNRLPFVIAELPMCGIRPASPDYETDAERCREWLGMADDYIFSGREDCWTYFRRMQKEMADIIPDTALASFYGAGEWNDLHPEDKKTAGYKMAETAFRFIEDKQS